jgi:hypothetical protein
MHLWHGTFHTKEPQAAAMEHIYQRLGIPSAQIYGLAQPVKGMNPHGEGIMNPAYQSLWEQMRSTKK